MDDHDMILSLILQGCKTAKDLESRLQSKTNLQPQVVAESCDEIVRVFSEARERLNAGGHGQDFNPLQMYSSPEGVDSRIFQEYFTKFLQARMMGGPGRSSSCSGILIEGSSSMAGGSGGLVMELGSGDMHAIGGAAALDSAVMGPSSHRKTRRKKDGDRRREMVPAPQTGNTNIPPDDGFTWRKYGQKEILGSKYPRGYYRCTHQKLYNCPAKKQVQRMDDNPSIYEVTYRGEHTCHKSATAPSVAPPPPSEITPQHMTQALTAAATTQFQPLGKWLEFSLGGGSGGADSGAGPSATMNRNVYQFPVADMADVMFNSGSSSSNSIEFIFSSGTDDRWESGDKKN